ncbi:MAG: DUF2147 domain-containing protein [Chitinophagales bacterium]|nr:DUF2147 domain-containing protein [Chitinophagales bacterium]
MEKANLIYQFVVKSILLLLFGVISIHIQAQGSANEIIGIWETEAKDGKMEIYKCGDRYCGKLLWGTEIVNTDGTSKKDNNNPDKNLRSRDLVGITNLTGLRYGQDTYEDGKIYNAANGKIYDCYVWLDKGKMHLRGYIGMKMLGQTSIWNRVK